jgi:hypothetical protein
MAVTFISGGNQSTQRIPPTCGKSLANFISKLRKLQNSITIPIYYITGYMILFHTYCIIFSMYRSMFNRLNVGWRGHDHMVVGFTITYAISTYHHYMVVGFTTTYI